MSESSGKTPTRLGVNKNPKAGSTGGTKLSYTKKSDVAPGGDYDNTSTSTRAKVNAPRAAARQSGPKGGRGKLPLIIILVVIILAAGGFAGWKFLGGKSAPDGGEPQMPVRQVQATGNIEYKHNTIDITYKREQPIEGQFIVTGYTSWENSDQRFSDGHISLLPLGTAQTLRQKYQNIFNADGDPQGQQILRDTVLNMPYIYSQTNPAAVKKGLDEIAVNYTPDRIILIRIKGTILSYVKGSRAGNDMPSPHLEGGGNFQFVELNDVEIMDYNWSYGN